MNYHQRFSERFGEEFEPWGDGRKVIRYKDFEIADILAFIDEVVAEERSEVDEAVKKLAQITDFSHVTDDTRTTATQLIQAKQELDRTNLLKKYRDDALNSYERGRKAERASLIEKVKGMKVDWNPTVPPKDGYIGKNVSKYYEGYNMALSDLLTHLRGEQEKDWNDAVAAIGTENRPQSPTQAKTECCEKCEGFDSKGEESWTYCQVNFRGCCHKPRTEETEKEGSSFSGRDVVAEFEARFPEAEYGEDWGQNFHDDCRPKRI